MLVEVTKKKESPGQKALEQQVKFVTQLNHFLFNDSSLTAWRNSGIGSGKVIPMKPLPKLSSLSRCELMSPKVPIKKTVHTLKMAGSTDPRTSAKDINDEVAGRPVKAVFKCPNPLCDEAYKSNAALEKHQLSRACAAKRKNQESGMGYVTRKYVGSFAASKEENFSRFERRSLLTNFKELHLAIPLEDIPRDKTFEPHIFKEGFALKRRKAGTVYTKKQLSYLKGLFDFGERRNNKKYTYEEAVVMMRKATVDGDPTKLLFTEKEWLDEYQVKYQFAKMAAQLRRNEVTNPEALIDNSAIHAEIEEMDAEERNIIVDELAREMETLQDDGYGGNEEQDHPYIVGLIRLLF